jgi:hypothetical protein
VVRARAEAFPLESYDEFARVHQRYNAVWLTYQVSAAPGERKRGRRLLQIGVGRLAQNGD